MSTLKINKKIAEVQEKFSKIGLKTFPIIFDIMKLKTGCSGRAALRTNSIQISSDYLKEFPEEVLSVTVPHEICHLYVNRYFPMAKQHHGPEFRQLMNLIGLPGKTYHNMQLKSGTSPRKTKTRYIYLSTSGKKYELTSGQHKKAISFPSCTIKGESIKFTGTIKTFK